MAGSRPLACAVFALLSLCEGAAEANAQEVSLNYDTLASLEEPIATNIGDVTFSLTGLIDVSLAAEDEAEDDGVAIEPGVVGNFNATAETQLGNRWRLGAAYFGQYASRELDSLVGPDGYSDNVAAFVGTSFGTVIAGNIRGQVRELTRRRRGAGHAALAMDDLSARLDDWGLAYLGRFGPSVVGIAVDDDGNFDLGLTYQRPRGVIDYRLSARVLHVASSSSGETPDDGTTGVMAVIEGTYASSTFDVGLAYESLETAHGSPDRWFVSAGARTQIGPWLLSGEGHFGELSGHSEFSLAAGAAFFVARGLSLNAGANYQQMAFFEGSGRVVDREEWQCVISVRFAY